MYTEQTFRDHLRRLAAQRAAGPLIGGQRPPGGTAGAMDVGGTAGYYEDGSPRTGSSVLPPPPPPLPPAAGPLIGGQRPPGGTAGYPDTGGTAGQYEDGSARQRPLTPFELALLDQLLSQWRGPR